MGRGHGGIQLNSNRGFNYSRSLEKIGPAGQAILKKINSDFLFETDFSTHLDYQAFERLEESSEGRSIDYVEIPTADIKDVVRSIVSNMNTVVNIQGLRFQQYLESQGIDSPEEKDFIQFAQARGKTDPKDSPDTYAYAKTATYPPQFFARIKEWDKNISEDDQKKLEQIVLEATGEHELNSDFIFSADIGGDYYSDAVDAIHMDSKVLKEIGDSIYDLLDQSKR